MAQWLLGTLIASMLALLLFGGDVILPLKSKFFGSESGTEELSRVQSELVRLKTELTKLKNFPGSISDDSFKLIPAFVYSTYPFNDKHLLTVNAGEKNGVREGMAALSGERIFVGKVVRVFREASSVQTIFDPNFELPVRIGEGAENALLKGGAVPHLDLIEKKALVKQGDSVYSAASQLPYGLPIGTVGEIKDLDYEAFRSAALALPYNLNELKILLMVRSGSER